MDSLEFVKFFVWESIQDAVTIVKSRSYGCVDQLLSIFCIEVPAQFTSSINGIRGASAHVIDVTGHGEIIVQDYTEVAHCLRWINRSITNVDMNVRNILGKTGRHVGQLNLGIFKRCHN